MLICIFTYTKFIVLFKSLPWKTQFNTENKKQLLPPPKKKHCFLAAAVLFLSVGLIYLNCQHELSTTFFFLGGTSETPLNNILLFILLFIMK